MDSPAGQIDDPKLGDPVPSVQGSFDFTVVPESRVTDLNE
jgi:hypothetical protein